MIKDINFFKKYICTYSYLESLKKESSVIFKIIEKINSIDDKDKIKIITEINKKVIDRDIVLEKLDEFKRVIGNNNDNGFFIPLFILYFSETFITKYGYIIYYFKEIKDDNSFISIKEMFADRLINRNGVILDITNKYYEISGYDILYKEKNDNDRGLLTMDGFELLFNNFYENKDKTKEILENENKSISNIVNKRIEKRYYEYKISNVFIIKYIMFVHLFKKYNKQQ